MKQKNEIKNGYLNVVVHVMKDISSFRRTCRVIESAAYFKENEEMKRGRRTE